MKRLLVFASIALLAACGGPKAVQYSTSDTTITLKNCSPAAVDWSDATQTHLIIGCPASGTAPPQPPQCPSPPGAGPCDTPPPSGTIACTGFAATRVIDVPFVSNVRVFTKDHGGFGPNDAIVLRFTTTSGPSITNNLPRIVGAEWIDPLYVRTGVLSPSACDFGPQQYPLGVVTGTSLSMPFTVNNPQNGGLYPILKPNKTYYFNVKNNAGSGCVAAHCDMFFDLYNANTP
jgi:hypothetical protein